MEELYFVSYMRKNGKDVDEYYNNYEDAYTRRNILINEFGYLESEIKLSCKLMKK